MGRNRKKSGTGAVAVERESRSIDVTGGVSNEVLDSIIDRVSKQGGLSVKIESGNEPVVGYMVAKVGYSEIVPADQFYDIETGRKAIADYLWKYRDLFGDSSYLGLWHDQASGQVYFDISDNITDRDEAIRAGVERNQIAIWDIVNMEEIGTGGTGENP